MTVSWSGIMGNGSGTITDGPLELTVHISLLLVLNESIAARFAGFTIRHHVDLLDRAILLKLSLKFGLRRVVVLQKNIGKL